MISGKSAFSVWTRIKLLIHSFALKNKLTLKDLFQGEFVCFHFLYCHLNLGYDPSTRSIIAYSPK